MWKHAFRYIPVDIGRKLNVHKTLRRRPERLLNVLCTFNLRIVSTGILSFSKKEKEFCKEKCGTSKKIKSV